MQKAVLFCIRRLSRDWGDDATDNALQELESLARDAIHLVAPQLDALLGYLLEICEDKPESSVLNSPNISDDTAPIQALERRGRASQLSAQRRRTAELIGRICVYEPRPALERINALLSVEPNDSAGHIRLKMMLLHALEEAVNPDLLKHVLPVAYTALLGNDPAIRSAAIRLWAACAGVAHDAMPENFAELAPALLSDQYIVVHEEMLSKLPDLRLPSRLAPSVIPIVAGWAGVKKNNQTALDDCVEALIDLAGDL